ncbi:MAG: T9SS type A sorting domain-containing protein [Rhodothermaceae bacterium]|nr:T9SS type A sorting domain-containing protein [Rhodothermaceae bacterium]
MAHTYHTTSTLRSGLCWMGVCLFALLFTTELQAQVETKFFGSDIEPTDGFGVAVSLSGHRLLVSAPVLSTTPGKPGAAYIFELQSDGSWLETAKLVADDSDVTNFFGTSAALDGNYAIIGARGTTATDTPGAAYIFERRKDGTWEQVATFLSDGDPFGDGYARTVAISGRTAIVGAHFDDALYAQGGAAYVYERKGAGEWVQVAKLTASDAEAFGNFGRSVSIDGYRALVGSPGRTVDGVRTGGGFVYERQPGGAWEEITILEAPDVEGGQGNFSQAVSLSGDRALIGAADANVNGMLTTGLAYMFKKEGKGEWQLDQKIINRDVRENARFGRNVALNGEVALIYAGNQLMSPKKFEPAVYLYRLASNGRWQEVSRLLASDYNNDTNFGTTSFGATVLAVDESRALIGASHNDEAGLNAGAVYNYDLAGLSASIAEASEGMGDMIKANELPGAFELFESYPNPFNPTTTIGFALPEQAPVQLAIYDMMGREVANLVQGVLNAGTHEVVFDASGLPSGTYLYKLDTPARSFTQKMLLLK